MERSKSSFYLWNRLKAHLQRPFPTTRKPWRLSLIASLIVFFLLVLFQSIPNTSITSRIFIFLGFALVTGIVTSAFLFIPPLIFKKFYLEDNWNVGKQILQTTFILLFIGIGNCIYSWMISGRISFSLLVGYIIYTFLVGVIPTIIVSYYTQSISLKQNLQETLILNKKLSQQEKNKENNVEPNAVTINFNGTIELNPEDILYIESVKNYCTIIYTSEGKLQSCTIRSTLSQIEESLSAYPFLIRCHRAFIVNKLSILTVEGNSQGYQLELKSGKNIIPVSRSYTKIFREQFIG